MVLLWKNKMIFKSKQLSNACEMFVATLMRRFVAAKRLFTDL